MALNLRTTPTEFGETAFGTTNRWFDFALRWWEEKAGFSERFSGDKIGYYLDELLPAQLRDIGYTPAERVMRGWASGFFHQQDEETGLIPSGLRGSPGTHPLKMLRRMNDFLEWFPHDEPFISACQRWAGGVISPPPGGHRVTAESWLLHHAVDAASRAPVELPGEGPKKLDKNHGVVAVAFEHLSSVLAPRPALPGFPHGRPDWFPWRLPPWPWPRPRRRAVSPIAAFARQINREAFENRPVADVNLMRDKVTSEGFLRGDVLGPADDPLYRPDRPHAGEAFDTDCLYWARQMFAAYWLAGGDARPDLRPSRTFPLYTRRQLLERLAMPSVRQALTGDPDPSAAARWYLRMGLSLTIDWMRGAWCYEPPGRHYFVRKVYLEGDRGGYSAIYGDGIWNTMFVLVEAFRATGDWHYLKYLGAMWDTLEDIAEQVFEWNGFDVRNRRGLVYPLRGGEMDPDLAMVRQAPLMWVMLKAYSATDDWHSPSSEYLENAWRLADRLERLVGPSLEEPTLEHRRFNPALPLAPGSASPFLALAIAAGDLFRVSLSSAEPGMTLHVSPVVAGRDSVPTTIALPGTRAVVYMNPGTYRATIQTASGEEAIWDMPLVEASVPDDTPIEVPRP